MEPTSSKYRTIFIQDFNNITIKPNYSLTSFPPITSSYDLSDAGNVFYLLVVALMLIGGTFGNFMVIGAVLVHKILRTPGNVFIINLAIADSCVSFLTNSFQLYGNIKGGENFFVNKRGLCLVLAYVCMTSCVESLWTILMISFNRYVALVHYQRYSSLFTWRNSVLICVGLWLAAMLATSTPFYGFGAYIYDRKMSLCVNSRHTGYAYNMYLITIMFSLPLVGIIYCYLRIYLFVRERKAALRKMTNKLQDANTRKEQEETRLAKTLFIVFVGFIVCWLPATVVYISDPEDRFPAGVYMFIVTMAHVSSSGLNFLIYGVTNRRFRDGYGKLLLTLVGKGHRVRGSEQRGGSSTAESRDKATAVTAITLATVVSTHR